MKMTGTEASPFVTTLPEELTIYICTSISAPRDRLRLALCCKTLARIIIPQHLDSFEHIRLDPNRAGVWDYLELAGKRRLARV